MSEATDDDGSVRFMPQLIGLDYAIRTNPTAQAFGEALTGGRITGHRCPSCSRVYTPPKGFCPICVVPTGPDDLVEVADRGLVTSWTVLTPIQYAGQQEREDYALASILLDGADGTIGQQRLVDVPLDRIRMGMRVEAVWNPPDERVPDDRGYALGTAVSGWRPSGEPDAAREKFAEHVL